jgi:periplasmic protein CpxP/Spy
MSHSRWSTLTILVLLAAGLTFAQTSQQSQAPTPENPKAVTHRAAPTVDQQLQRLSDKLNLTDDQKTKLKPILQDQMDQMKAVRDDTSLTPEQKRAKMKSTHASVNDQINAVLTPEQQVKYKQMQQERTEKRKD